MSIIDFVLALEDASGLAIANPDLTEENFKYPFTARGLRGGEQRRCGLAAQ